MHAVLENIYVFILLLCHKTCRLYGMQKYTLNFQAHYIIENCPLRPRPSSAFKGGSRNFLSLHSTLVVRPSTPSVFPYSRMCSNGLLPTKMPLLSLSISCSPSLSAPSSASPFPPPLSYIPFACARVLFASPLPLNCP